jgi:MbtH protein
VTSVLRDWDRQFREDHVADAAADYQVVMNHEEQYSVWPAGRELPAGWHPAGFAGTRDECLARIDEVWTDITPLSVRQALSAARG